MQKWLVSGRTLLEDCHVKIPPLNLKLGDVVYFDLTAPLRREDGSGGEETQDFIRLQVDEISELGIAGRGSDITGSIVPTRNGESEKIGGPGVKVEFFPWSSVLRLHLLYPYAEYEEIWGRDNES